jgi:hypothetical protein
MLRSSADAPLARQIDADEGATAAASLPRIDLTDAPSQLLMGHINPLTGDQKRNSRLRVGFFSQHHIDQVRPSAPLGVARH